MYNEFAEVYDKLMEDAEYKKRAAYLCTLFKKYDRMPTLLLDLACGTGGFSNEFAKLGVDVIGVDISEEMLSAARENSAKQQNNILYLCQSAEELDLYGTIDGAICCLDSLNHIIDYDELCRSIARVSLFLEKDRLFIFDVNSVYKHKMVLGDNTFVIENDNVYCVWQNYYDEVNHITDIDLDFFVKDGEKYKRLCDSFSERAYTANELENAVKAAGLQIVAVYSEFTEEPPEDNTERIIYITRKATDN